MSGYRQSTVHEVGTGPLDVNHQILSLTHKLKTCDRCMHERTPGGGTQISPTKWICSTCWKPHLQEQKLRLKSKSAVVPV